MGLFKIHGDFLLESKETWIGFTPSDQEHHVDPNPKQGNEPILRATFYQIFLGQWVRF